MNLFRCLVGIFSWRAWHLMPKLGLVTVMNALLGVCQVAEEYILDTVEAFESDRVECAKRLAGGEHAPAALRCAALRCAVVSSASQVVPPRLYCSVPRPAGGMWC